MNMQALTCPVLLLLLVELQLAVRRTFYEQGFCLGLRGHPAQPSHSVGTSAEIEDFQSWLCLQWGAREHSSELERVPLGPERYSNVYLKAHAHDLLGSDLNDARLPLSSQ